MNQRIYLSLLVCVVVISTVMTATMNKVTKKEKNASSSSSVSKTLSLLALQPVRECAILQDTTTSGTTSYRLVKTVGEQETVLFSNHPVQAATPTSTQPFVDNFIFRDVCVLESQYGHFICPGRQQSVDCGDNRGQDCYA